MDTCPEDSRIIRTAREVNDYKPVWVVEKIKAGIADILATKTSWKMPNVKVACFGLAFKPEIDDLRESPALDIVRKVAALGCQVLAVEPYISTLPAEFISDKVVLATLETAVAEADLLCVLVKHRAFLDATPLIKRHSRVIDAVGLLA